METNDLPNQVNILTEQVQSLHKEIVINQQRLLLIAETFLSIGNPQNDIKLIKAIAKEYGNQLRRSLPTK